MTQRPPDFATWRCSLRVAARSWDAASEQSRHVPAVAVDGRPAATAGRAAGGAAAAAAPARMQKSNCWRIRQQKIGFPAADSNVAPVAMSVASARGCLL